MSVEQGCFTPLLFSANDGMGCECKKSDSLLFEIIAPK